MSLGILANKDKIGNLMILLAGTLSPLYHTKLIKLLYLIDETAVKDDGIPVTWLDYKVWQYGPVAPETYFIKDNDHLFAKYIHTKKSENGTLIVPVSPFNENSFSEYELEIINQVISKYGSLSSEDLVQLTHEKNSLWYKTKLENDLDFENSIANVSDISIDLKRLVANDEQKLSKYEGAYEMLCFNLPSERSTYEECIR
jgi:uncharacterized phage-associated protein